METKFYAACLASYNNGILHGAWINASSDEDEMQEAVNAMLAASTVPDAEEWQVHDWDDPTGALSALGETSDLGRIADIVEAIEEVADDYDDGLVPHLIAWAKDRQDDPLFWASTISDAFGGVYNDPEDWVYEMTEQGDGIPSHVANYIDFRAMARDSALNGDVDFICTHTGDHMQDYDSMRGRECVVMWNH